MALKNRLWNDSMSDMEDIMSDVGDIFSTPAKTQKPARKANPDPLEKREDPRVFVNWRMVLVKKNGERVQGAIRNASMGGMCAHVELDMREDEPVEVHVEISQPRLCSRQIVTASCRLAYSLFSSNDYCIKVGLEIIEMSEAHRAIYEEEINIKLSVFGNGSLNAHIL